jgi:hypothetical protein
MAPKEDSGVSSVEMVLGEALVLPSQPAVTGQPPPLPGLSYRDVLYAYNVHNYDCRNLGIVWWQKSTKVMCEENPPFE